MTPLPPIQIIGKADDSDLLRLDTWPYTAVQVIGSDGQCILGIPLSIEMSIRLADAIHEVLRSEIDAMTELARRLRDSAWYQEAVQRARELPHPSKRGVAPVSVEEYMRLLDKRSKEEDER